MDPIIINKRATLFLSVPQVFDENSMPLYVKALIPMKLMPTFSQGVGIKIKPDGSVEPQKTINLEMRKLDNSLVVTLSPERIDIISNKDNETIETFNGVIEPIVAAIKTTYPHAFSRLAQYAAIMYKVEGVGFTEVYNKCFLPKKGENPDRFIEWSSRKVCRSSIGEDANAVVINNVESISRSKVQIGVSKGKDRIIQEIDINTVEHQSGDRVTGILVEFFDYSKNTIINSINNFNL